jgi:flagellin-specific chaperone FliS
VELGPSLVSPFFSPKFGDATLYISSQAVEPMEKKIELAVAGIQKTIKSIENLALRLNSEKDEKKREELQRRLSLKRQGLFKQQVTLKAEQLASVTALVHEMNHIREGYAIRMASSQAEFEHRAYSLERDMLLRLGIALKKQHPDPAKRAVIDAVIQETIENEIESSMEQAQVRPNWKG